jgi:hypothetical protein
MRLLPDDSSKLAPDHRQTAPQIYRTGRLKVKIIIRQPQAKDLASINSLTDSMQSYLAGLMD